MFAKTIVLSDAFLDMPLSAQALYFHLNMEAYNKGIVINPKSIARGLGADYSDLESLKDHNFISFNEDGSITITHWYENNGIGETAKKRNNYSYRKWRESILARDNYKCTKCGSKTKLHVHHINKFADYPELRLDDDNAITLCETCHFKIHGLTKGTKRGKKIGNI